MLNKARYVVIKAGKTGQNFRALVLNTQKPGLIVTNAGTFDCKTGKTVYFDSDYLLRSTEMFV